MANSFVRYTGNGTTTTYAIPFSYRSEDDLSATVAGISVTAYTLDAAGTNLTFTTAPANGAAIEIRRTTSQSTKLVDYVSGSVLTESDLDTDSDQAFYMSQEAIDKAGDVISLDNVDFNWDVQNKRLKNVANPVDNTDAVNKQFISTNLPNITTVAGIASDVTTVANNDANVTAVANDATDIGTVATNISSVNTVATNISDVVTVANDLNEAISEIETAANDLNEATSEIDTVSNNIANVNTVGTNISNVNTVATDIANVNSVAGNSTNINAVAGNETNINAVNANSSNINAVNSNSANINTVAGDTTAINTVANDGTDIGTVATNIANVNTVAGNNANITTVAGNNANVSTVAGISSNVTTVAGISSDVTSVANDATDIGTVATDIANVNSVAGNSTNINTVATNNSNINTVAGSIANVNTVATNISDVNNFADRYRVQAGEPSVDNDEGDLVYDTTANAVKVYNGTSFDTIQQGITDVAPTRHSIRPSLNLDFANSKVLDPRITFTRGSNATYYDGYTSVKAEENLLPYSQQFDETSYWITTTDGTITANQTTAPDGTTTADLFTEGTLSNSQNNIFTSQLRVQSSKTYTLSCYLKNNGSDYVYLSHRGSGLIYSVVEFNLSTGSFSRSGALGWTVDSYSITDVGNSWYRVSMTFTTNNTARSSESLRIGASDGTTAITSGYITITGDGTSGFYAWGAQVEQRDSLTAYTPTTSSPITKYQPALQTAGNNVARFDHNPTTGESLGLLIEESRTNVATYSEDYTQSVWTKSNTTITSNTIIAPDGVLTGSKLVENTVNTTHQIWRRPSFTLGNYYSFSFYGKSAEKSIIVSTLYNNSYTYARANFNLSSGTTTASTQPGCSSSIVDVGNGWYRCTLIGLADVTATGYAGLTLAPDGYTGNTQPSYTGDGYSGAYIWGAQVEQGSFPTSYIKTTGSQVTRSADDCEMLNIDQDDWLKQGVGTLYGEFSKPHTGQDNGSNRYPRVFGLTNDQFDTNEISIYFTQATTPNINTYSIKDGTVYHSNNLISSALANTYYKVSIAYERNNVDGSGNGSNVTTDTSAEIPFINRLRIFKRISYQNNANYGTIKKLSYYPIKLTKNEVIDLTEE